MQSNLPDGTDRSLLLNIRSWTELLPTFGRLRDHLTGAGYLATDRLPLPGGLVDLLLDIGNLAAFVRGRHNLFQHSGISGLYRTFFRATAKRAVALHKLFQLGASCSLVRAQALISPGLVAELLDTGVMEKVDGGIRSRVMVTPFRGQLYLSDQLRIQNHPEFVYMGRASFAVPELLIESMDASGGQGRLGRLLDVGSGCGILGVSVATQFDEIVGVDIVDRCLRFARLNATLNAVENCSFQYSDLYSNVEGSFDVIVTNPPLEWIGDEHEVKKTYATGGGDWGSELPEKILAGALERLTPEGVLYSTLSCPIIRGRPYVVDIMERVYGSTGADITIRPYIEDFRYERARKFHRAGISAIVRYLVTITQADKLSIRFEPGNFTRMMSYKLRAYIPKLAAMITGGPHSG